MLRRSSVYDLPFAQMMRSLNRTLHTGEAGGILGQTLAFLACIGGLVLVYTGFALSFRRFFKRPLRRVSAPAVVIASTPPVPPALPLPNASARSTT